MKSLLSIILCIFSLALIAQEKKKFNYGNWLTFYYKNPKPEHFVLAVQTMEKDGFFKNTNALAPIIVALGQVIADNPKQLDDWMKKLEQHRKSNVKVWDSILYFSNLKEAKKYITRDEIRNRKYVPVYKMPPNHPSVLDMNWAYFFVTGKKEPIRNIIRAFAKPRDKDDEIDKKNFASTLTRGAAKWSLGSNCKQHELVLKHCKDLLSSKDLTQSERKEVTEIVESVEKK